MGDNNDLSENLLDTSRSGSLGHNDSTVPTGTYGTRDDLPHKAGHQAHGGHDDHAPTGKDGFLRDDDEVGPVCVTCGLPWCNMRLCGCTSCVRKDKLMIAIITLIIILIIFAVVVTDLAEVSALARTSAETENVVNVTRSMVALFRTSFSFLGFGTLAMVGMVRTHDPDKAAQQLADARTGKIVQGALIIAIVAGAVCTALCFGVYSPFMQNVANKTSLDVSLGQDYVNWVAPTLPMAFTSMVLQAWCLQTGFIVLVIIDALLDLVVFSGIVLGWAKEAPPDDIVNRLGTCVFIVATVRFLVYALFCFRPSFVRRFKLLDFSLSDEMRVFVSKLGSDVAWQWAQNVVQAMCALVFLALANQISETTALSFYATQVIYTLQGLSAGVLAYYITFFGTRFLGDHRYSAYWGLMRCTQIWVVILTFFAFVGYSSVKEIAVDGVTNDANRADVNAQFGLSGVGVSIAVSVIFNNFALYYKGIFVSLHRFRTIFIVFSLSTVVIGLPLAGIARSSDSFQGLIFGAFVVPDVLQCLGFMYLWFYKVKPEQVAQHNKHVQAIASRMEKPDPDWLKLHEALGLFDFENLWDELTRDDETEDSFLGGASNSRL